MTTLYIDVPLDFCENRKLQAIKLKQFEDQGRTLRVFLYSNGRALTLGGLEQVHLNASVGGTVTAYELACQISDDGTYIEVPLHRRLTEIAGLEQCELKITNPQGMVIFTATFGLDIAPSVASTGSPAVLKTTELARALKAIEKRLDELESGISGVSMAYSFAEAVTESMVAPSVPFFPQQQDDERTGELTDNGSN